MKKSEKIKNTSVIKECVQKTVNCDCVNLIKWASKTNSDWVAECQGNGCDKCVMLKRTPELDSFIEELKKKKKDQMMHITSQHMHGLQWTKSTAVQWTETLDHWHGL